MTRAVPARRKAAAAAAVFAVLVGGGLLVRWIEARDADPPAATAGAPADGTAELARRPAPSPTAPEATAPVPAGPSTASPASAPGVTVPAPTDAVATAASEASPGRLLVPVAGVPREALRDTFEQARGARVHEAIDIMAPTGTPVLAVDDGTVAKRFQSVPGGTTLYQFDPSGRWAYYYAHLDRYADGIVEGKTVRRGEVIGYVGETGNVAPGAPHLHFAVFRLGPERQWWKGQAVNPFPLMR